MVQKSKNIKSFIFPPQSVICLILMTATPPVHVAAFTSFSCILTKSLYTAQRNIYSHFFNVKYTTLSRFLYFFFHLAIFLGDLSLSVYSFPTVYYSWIGLYGNSNLPFLYWFPYWSTILLLICSNQLLLQILLQWIDLFIRSFSTSMNLYISSQMWDYWVIGYRHF